MTRPARVVAVTGSAGLVAFQLALAAGAPWGALAWGGQHPGVLPRELRAGSAFSAAVWAVAFAAAAHPGEGARLTKVRTAYASVCAVGAVMNAASPSTPERLLWTPVSGALAVGFWRLRRR